MTKHNLVWVTEVYGEEDDEYSVFLDTDEFYEIGDGVKPANEVALQDLINFCEGAAENDNYHNFVNTPGRLAKIMQEAGIADELTLKVFIELAKHGGLHQL